MTTEEEHEDIIIIISIEYIIMYSISQTLISGRKTIQPSLMTGRAIPLN